MNSLSQWRVVLPLVIVLLVAVISWRRPLPRLRIVMLCIAAAVGYGIIQDQFTVRMCVEYFTIAHPPIDGVTNPTLLGLTWGFLGSWWAGLLAGLLAAMAATTGRWPQLYSRDLVRPVLIVMLMTILIAGSVWLFIYQRTDIADIVLDEFWQQKIAPERQQAFATVVLIHLAAYLSALIGSILLMVWIVFRRWCRQQAIKL